MAIIGAIVTAGLLINALLLLFLVTEALRSEKKALFLALGLFFAMWGEVLWYAAN
jgi:hypothetical protein